MALLSINPPNAPLTLSGDKIAPEWYRYFVSITRSTSEAGAGEVLTNPGSGLEGGGIVANGLSLSIANNGVSDAMLRDSNACSVIGRAANSSGDPADVIANANNRVLSRESDQLAFRDFINGILIGPTTASPLVRADAFETTQTPAASVTASTHSIPIETASGTFYIRLSATP